MGSRSAVKAQNDGAYEFSATCSAPPFETRGEKRGTFYFAQIRNFQFCLTKRKIL
jgi:hypothetical protein